jgi:hypothetical protein
MQVLSLKCRSIIGGFLMTAAGCQDNFFYLLQYPHVVIYKTDGGGRECALTKWSVQPSPLAPASSMVHSTAQPEFRIYRPPPP